MRQDSVYGAKEMRRSATIRKIAIHQSFGNVSKIRQYNIINMLFSFKRLMADVPQFKFLHTSVSFIAAALHRQDANGHEKVLQQASSAPTLKAQPFCNGYPRSRKHPASRFQFPTVMLRHRSGIYSRRLLHTPFLLPTISTPKSMLLLIYSIVVAAQLSP